LNDSISVTQNKRGLVLAVVVAHAGYAKCYWEPDLSAIWCNHTKKQFKQNSAFIFTIDHHNTYNCYHSVDK
jgi:hypothetical protein